ncbi:hypothetical protein LJC59_06760 [Desulfovibrio sp. OttesenSCG-928-A18]|nr:hypothetical protein [Desulfovibrio sp. OttesenSCG-928-A18]
MALWTPAPRFAQTSIPCPACRKELTARRSCHKAYLHCEKCRKDYELREFIRQMDPALEGFLEALYCDRI